MPCNDCICELTCEHFARCVLEPIPDDYPGDVVDPRILTELTISELSGMASPSLTATELAMNT